MGRHAHTRAVRWWIVAVALTALVAFGRDARADAKPAPPPSTAFFYGARVPVELYDQFDRVVVDPDHVASPPSGVRATAFAYVSLGEVHRSRAFIKDVPKRLVLGENSTFGSEIIDVASPEWRAFVMDRLITPLYQKGYRGFFFDTLDSFKKLSPSPDKTKASVAGLAAIVAAVKQKHPDAKVLLNRGFELLPAVGKSIDGFVAESLFESYDHSGKRYVPMSEAETKTLTTLLQDVKTRHGVPISVIDYAEPHKRVETAKKILALGFDPWVSGPSLDQIGVGRVQIVPRKIMLLYRHGDEGYLGIQDACVLIAPILEWLGYVPEYVDIRKGLPDHSLVGQYAGVVVFVPEGAKNEVALRRWLSRQLDDGIKLAFLYGFGFNADAAFVARLGLASAGEVIKPPLKLTTSPYVGLEAKPRARLLDRPPVKVVRPDVKSFLHLEDAEKNVWDGVVIGPWGGAAFGPYVMEDGLGGIRRWILDPFKFLKDALALPPIPAPDVTTESGRRIWTNHIDGDAFYSRAERKGNPFTATLILDEVLKKFRVPHTVSIVEGEIGPDGLILHPPANKPYPDPTIKTEAQKIAKMNELQDIAREIFKLPWVEIASHTFSHPFFWEDAEAGKTAPHGWEPVHLLIDGYLGHFTIERDIKGSIDFINKNLAPPGKKVRVLLWSGSCSPSREAVALTQKLGVFNVNGGGATRTFDRPFLAYGSAMGIPKGGGAYQVFAPIENENVYTNDFLGPYYGYRRAIDTQMLNDSPRRLSILTIYYHFYSSAKNAALVALQDVYAWALKQETTPLYLSEYAPKVLGFQRASVAIRLDDGGWQLGGFGELRTVRLDRALGWPDVVRSEGIAGVRDVPQGRYVTMSRDVDPVLYLSDKAPTKPYIDNANARVLSYKRTGNKVSLKLTGHMPLVVTVGGSGACTLSTKHGTAKAGRAGGKQVFSLTATETGDASLDCR